MQLSYIVDAAKADGTFEQVRDLIDLLHVYFKDAE